MKKKKKAKMMEVLRKDYFIQKFCDAYHIYGANREAIKFISTRVMWNPDKKFEEIPFNSAMETIGTILINLVCLPFLWIPIVKYNHAAANRIHSSKEYREDVYRVLTEHIEPWIDSLNVDHSYLGTKIPYEETKEIQLMSHPVHYISEFFFQTKPEHGFRNFKIVKIDGGKYNEYKVFWGGKCEKDRFASATTRDILEVFKISSAVKGFRLSGETQDGFEEYKRNERVVLVKFEEGQKNEKGQTEYSLIMRDKTQEKMNLEMSG